MRPPTHHLALALFIVAIVAAYWRAPAVSSTEFSPPAKAVASSLPAQFASEMLPEQDAAAATAFEIGFVFNKYTLGEECLQRLGFTPEQYNNFEWSLL